MICTAANATACVARAEGRDAVGVCDDTMVRLTRLARTSHESALEQVRRLVDVAYEKCPR
jgi:hypothetical protein